jgi:U3 small nucleolar RNA-associated protein 21
MPDTGEPQTAVASSTKRRKVASKENGTEKSRVPQIFTPFRAIGIVSNQVPPAVQVRGKSYIVTTCVGKAFQTYDVSILLSLY